MTRTRKTALTAIGATALVALVSGFIPLPNEASSSETKTASSPQDAEALGRAIFAGGCFWCVESDFDHVPGVVKTTSGYMGGTSDNATYKTHTKYGHREVVEILYNKEETSFEKLLDAFFRSTDPTDIGGQFCDRGFSYSTAVYATDDEQRIAAEAAKAQAMMDLDQEIATEIADVADFWPAETYHQDYYQKNPVRYKGYRFACGRDKRVAQLWGDDARRGIDAH